YDCARGIGSSACSFIVDVTNQSSGDTNGWCNARSWLPLEGALENVWDAGVLPVVATMNDNYYPTNDECYVRSPADVPKAFAVGAPEPSDTLPYPSWPIVYYSNRGGGLSRWWQPIGQWINSSTAMSMVDLVASGRPGYVTNASGLFGNVQVDGPHTPD